MDTSILDARDNSPSPAASHPGSPLSYIESFQASLSPPLTTSILLPPHPAPPSVRPPKPTDPPTPRVADSFAPYVTHLLSLRLNSKSSVPQPPPSPGTRPMQWPNYAAGASPPLWSSTGLATRLSSLPSTCSITLCLDASELGLSFHPHFSPTLFWARDPKLNFFLLSGDSWISIFEEAVHHFLSDPHPCKALILGGLGSLMFNNATRSYKTSPSTFLSFFLPLCNLLLQLTVVPGQVILLLPLPRGHLDLLPDYLSCCTEFICGLGFRPDLASFMMSARIIYTPHFLSTIATHPPFTKGGYKAMFPPLPSGGFGPAAPAVFSQLSDLLMSEILASLSNNPQDRTFLPNCGSLPGLSVLNPSSFRPHPVFPDRLTPHHSTSTFRTPSFTEEFSDPDTPIPPLLSASYPRHAAPPPPVRPRPIAHHPPAHHPPARRPPARPRPLLPLIPAGPPDRPLRYDPGPTSYQGPSNRRPRPRDRHSLPPPPLLKRGTHPHY